MVVLQLATDVRPQVTVFRARRKDGCGRWWLVLSVCVCVRIACLDHGRLTIHPFVSTYFVPTAKCIFA